MSDARYKDRAFIIAAHIGHFSPRGASGSDNSLVILALQDFRIMPVAFANGKKYTGEMEPSGEIQAADHIKRYSAVIGEYSYKAIFPGTYEIAGLSLSYEESVQDYN